jgi:hypothetical protein
MRCVQSPQFQGTRPSRAASRRSALAVRRGIGGVHRRRSDPDLDGPNLTTGTERMLTTSAGHVMSPAYSPDGRWMAYLGHQHGSEADRPGLP